MKPFMIEQRISVIRARIEGACRRAGRDPGAVTLVAVTKMRPVAQVIELVRAGIGDIGENRVQQAREKFPALGSTGLKVCTHLIGHLQTNKVKDAVRLFDVIHSVDSVKLLAALDEAAASAGVTPHILLEVKTSPEPGKSGVMPAQLDELVVAARGCAHLLLRGLMTIAPLGARADAARPYFRQLRVLRDAAGLQELSMGMSDDFEVAVEEGATIVRIGRALFEDL